jgi:hypothetical protein
MEYLGTETFLSDFARILMEYNSEVSGSLFVAKK